MPIGRTLTRALTLALTLALALALALWRQVAAATPELVLGLEGEPYFLLTRPSELTRPSAEELTRTSAEAEAAQAPADANPDANPDPNPNPNRRELLPYALRAECTHLGCLVQPTPVRVRVRLGLGSGLGEG